MSVSQFLQQAKDDFNKTLEHLKGEFSRLQIGRAQAALVESISVEAYGSWQPIKALASISIPDARTIQIQPWDKTVVSNIEKAIQTSELNINPINDGGVLRLVVPALTEERRKELSKLVHKMAEETKISVRNIRHAVYNKFKDMEKNKEITEDQLRHYEKDVQAKVDEINQAIEQLAQKKETDIMSL